MMLSLALSMTLAGTSPLEPSLYETRLSPQQGMLVESLKAGPGQQLAHGIKLIVGGSILGTVGAAGIVTGAILLGNAELSSGGAESVSRILGWAVFGTGALFAVIGVPLVIAGIIVAATSPLAKRAAVGVTRNGNLAVFF